MEVLFYVVCAIGIIISIGTMMRLFYCKGKADAMHEVYQEKHKQLMDMLHITNETKD